MERFVGQFYQNVLKDDRINTFYIENVSDISGLHSILSDFVSQMFGGPQIYKGRDLITIHKDMNITQEHYAINWEHMESAFLMNKRIDK